MRLAPVLLVVLVLLAGCAKNEAPAAAPSATGSPTAPAPAATASATSSSASPAPAPAAPPPQTVQVSVEGAYPVNPSFSPSELEVRSGATVTVAYADNDLNPLGSHNLVVDGVGLVVEEVPQGQTGQGEFVAPAPGDYAFYCSLQGHREAGMEGVLHVTA